ncbi:MBL fold metallo-hydrolase [Leptospira sp. WS92.C1]
MKTPEAFLLEGGSIFVKRNVLHTAILVEHPKGKFLFDTGLGTNIQEQFDQNPFHLKILMAYKNHESALVQLLKAGYDPKQIDQIYLSHMHWDHASGIKDFPWAKIFVSREEHNTALIADIKDGYIQSQFDGDRISWGELNFDDISYESYSKSLNLFGDGSVVFVPMMGHGGGSIGMFLNLSSKKRYFFTGDIAWIKEGFTLPAHKPRVSRRIADADPVALGKELFRVHELVIRKPEIVLIPAHDSIAQESLATFPKWNE